MAREHFSISFDNELVKLRTMLLEMGDKVEMMVSGSVKALMERDLLLASQIIAMDHEVNHYEVTIDENCLELLALHQPTARDLRFITLAMKIVTELERIGDKCVNIAKRSRKLNDEPHLKHSIDFPYMANRAELMVKEAIDAFLQGDADLAVKICNDTSVDEISDKNLHELLRLMLEDQNAVARAFMLNYVVKSLERIAGHATNIAELVIFMVKGKDIRHTTS